jgi:hypothetical protein
MRDWIANLKKWDGRNYYLPMYGHDASVLFDCDTCGDPTSGSYIGPILSNMCWECNTKYSELWNNMNRR